MNAKGHIKIRVLEDIYTRCPKAWIRDHCEPLLYYVEAHNHLQAGHGLPSAGGLNDQDPKTLQALAILASETERAKEARRAAGL